MPVPTKKIEELIQSCRDIKRKLGPESHRIHVDDIADTLQILIDDRCAYVAREAIAFGPDAADLNYVANKLADWPHGL
jgi:hypothetical protein